jgi:hypothetical protein
MTPSDALRDLDRMTSRFDALLAELCRSCLAARSQWTALGRVGGQRDDHAAALLAPLRTDLAALSTLAQTCHQQIDAMVADPFGDAQAVEARAAR